MFHRFNQKNSRLGLLVFLGCVSWVLPDLFSELRTQKAIAPVWAHEVQRAGDVAGMFHVEPNDNPRSGQTSVVWFALTRRGGQIIPLSQCKCQLAVYAQPRNEGDRALMTPTLKAISAERYQDVPGAEIVFPQSGIYQLEISGKPQDGANFQPFTLTFTITVR